MFHEICGIGEVSPEVNSGAKKGTMMEDAKNLVTVLAGVIVILSAFGALLLWAVGTQLAPLHKDITALQDATTSLQQDVDKLEDKTGKFHGRLSVVETKTDRIGVSNIYLSTDRPTDARPSRPKAQ